MGLKKERPYSHLPCPPESMPKMRDEVDLNELLRAVWRGKWVVISISFIFAVGAVFYSLSLPNIYKADALLAPAENSNSGGLSNIAGQFGGLAALTGVNLNAGESSQTELAIQVMKSRQFVDSFVNQHDLIVPLMAAKEWSLNDNKLIIDQDVFDSKAQRWLREPDGLRGAEPSAQEVYEVFIKEVLSIVQDKDAGLYTLSVKSLSPYLAQQWVSWLIDDINKVMRERTINETSQNLMYLNNQLQRTAVADMQSTFYKLIEEQTKSLMLAEVQDEFVFKVIDPAVVPELKAEPKRALICVFGTLLGGLLGIVIVLIRFIFSKDKEL